MFGSKFDGYHCIMPNMIGSSFFLPNEIHINNYSLGCQICNYDCETSCYTSFVVKQQSAMDTIKWVL